jgi:hypothetical protein
MKVTFRRLPPIILGFVILVPPLEGADFPTPNCLKPYAGHLREILAREEAEELFVVVGGFSSDAQAGARALMDVREGGSALYEMVFDILEQTFPAGSRANPFESDEALFEVMGRLYQPGGRPGTDTVIKRVTSLTEDRDGFLVSQGAIFDLYMARSAATEGSGYSDVLSFDALFEPAGLQRRPDMLSRCNGCESLLGVHHENKNWTKPLTGDLDNPTKGSLYFQYTDEKVNRLASEFARDILLHGPTGFQHYRLNFRNVPEVAAQKDEIRKVLIKQFESPLVTGQIDDPQAFLEAFEENFDDIVGFY